MSRDYQDVIGGALLCVVGLVTAGYAWANYPLGTMGQMGPGAFPTMLGCLLAVFGVLTVIPALFRPGQVHDTVDVWIAGPILGSLVTFAATVSTFGLIPASLLLIVISSLPVRNFSIVSVGLLAVGMTAFVTLVFVLGLRIPIPMINWPF